MGAMRYLVADVLMLAFAGFASVVAGGQATAAAPRKVDPEADRLVRQTADYIAGTVPPMPPEKEILRPLLLRER